MFFFLSRPNCKSRWHFGAGLANCANRACTLLSIYCLMVKSCNTFGVATSPNVALICPLLSMPDNGMTPNTWSCPGIIIRQSLTKHSQTPASLFLVLCQSFLPAWCLSNSAKCSLDFRSTKRALSDVLSTKSSTKRRKTRDAQSTKSIFYEH